jgi:hypothetical protein
MRKNSSIIAELALAAFVALPSWAGAACPGAQTYFFSGHGDIILQLTPTSSPCDADVVLNGDLTTSNGVSCLSGCPSSTTATASITEVIKTGACGIPNSTHGGYDGISLPPPFDEAMRRHQREIMRFIRRATGDRNDGSTFFQEMLRRLPSQVGHQPTLTTEISELQERIASIAGAAITVLQAVYVSADDFTEGAAEY